MKLNSVPPIGVFFIILFTASMSASLGSFLGKEKGYKLGYQEGSVHTAELLKEMSNLTPAQKQEIAVIWWTDTKDMLSARKALCGKPKSTQTKKD